MGRLWSAAWGLDEAKGVYMAVWRRADGDHCLGQALRGESEAIKARFLAEVAHKEKDGYQALGRRRRLGLPRWKDGSAVEIALSASALGGSPVVLAWVSLLRDCPFQSACALRPPPPGCWSSVPSFGRKLFWLAHA